VAVAAGNVADLGWQSRCIGTDSWDNENESPGSAARVSQDGGSIEDLGGKNSAEQQCAEGPEKKIRRNKKIMYVK
jgi:hypothetical protein